jgi:hypothetical protein
MLRRPTCWMILVSAFAAPGAGRAHHSAAVHFLVDQEVAVAGKIVEFRFSNPHSVIFLTAKDEQGQDVVWAIEWNGSSSLLRRGLSRTTFSPGDEVTIFGNPARDGSRTLMMKEATFADGRPPINRGARRESEDSVNEDE